MKKIIYILIIVLCLTGCNITNDETTAESSESIEESYENKVFDVSYVHDINIEAAESDWNKLLKDPVSGEKIKADITIDGECFKDVAVSIKGSYSLRSVAENEDSNRYSLKIKFNKYVDDTYYGLDTLDLNNSVSDPSLMKDYVAYNMFRSMGIASPLCSYANVSVNGESYGLLLAVEDIKKSFLNRNFDGKGELYKPEAKTITENNNKIKADIEEALLNGETYNSYTKGVVWEVNEYTPGADLIYTGDSLDNYPDIFDHCITDVDDSDKERLVQALKELSEGDVQDCVDINEVITYFVVHNFTNNYDSYTGGFNHNYILYENNGKLAMIPWDYDFFNAMSTDEMADTLDFPPFYRVDTSIDSPLVVSSESRPMWAWIVNDETYLDQYHKTFREFLDYVESGAIINEIDRVNEMIREYVEKDSSYMCTMNEYDATVNDLKEYMTQRTTTLA